MQLKSILKDIENILNIEKLTEMGVSNELKNFIFALGEQRTKIAHPFPECYTAEEIREMFQDL